ncbi:hypothetical protein [Roseomonas marmotae]|uniref:DUF4164 family protein n=1 Tax=Roseomonas marmotae TaxID=2768161 RepID=A0ABS3KGL1_9PROT|nr:hypothetical protein [Roseomonas marmotae]MBO1076112.1 hypothetical protein [Roseomonas marmotae]QTI81348.1 hypothetical protein IAI58_18510 [Roseomonas marmotae]
MTSRRPGDGLRAIIRRACLPRPAQRQDHQLRALELTLEAMADRLARAELLAARQAAHARRHEARALAAEDALIRLQDALNQARQSLPA